MICKPCSNGQQLANKHRLGRGNLPPNIRKMAQSLHKDCKKNGCVCKHGT